MNFKARLLPLLTGNLVAQSLQIAAIPALTRLYGPERYGEYGVFAAALMFAGMLATFRYELAIQLPKHEAIARCLAGLAAVMAALVAVCVFGIAAFATPFFNPSIDVTSFALLLAGSTLLLGLFNVLNALSLRAGRYRANGLAKVVQVGVSVSCATIAYQLGFEALGLLYANMLGYLFGCFFLSALTSTVGQWVLPNTHWLRALRLVAKRYSGFAIFNTPQALMDGLRPIAILFFIQSAFGIAAAGHYHIANQLLQTPASVVTQAVSQVHYRFLVENMGSPEIRRRLLKVVIVLLGIAMIGGVAVASLSQPLANWLFGARWLGIDKTLNALIVAVAVNFVTAPLVYVFHARRRHREFLVWGAVYNVVAIASIWVASALLSNASDALLIYSVSSGVVLVVLAIRSISLSVGR